MDIMGIDAKYFLVGIVGATLLLFLMGKKPLGAIITPQGQSLDELYDKWGNIYGVDPMLLKAIAKVESNENPKAKNPNDPSYGLMQIFYTGTNKFYIDGWPPSSEEQLYDPDYNLKLGRKS